MNCKLSDVYIKQGGTTRLQQKDYRLLQLPYNNHYNYAFYAFLHNPPLPLRLNILSSLNHFNHGQGRLRARAPSSQSSGQETGENPSRRHARPVQTQTETRGSPIRAPLRDDGWLVLETQAGRPRSDGLLALYGNGKGGGLFANTHFSFQNNIRDNHSMPSMA